MSGLRTPTPGWARSAGHARLRPPPADDQSAAGALARCLVAECIARYGWAYDERDPAALGDCFTPDGVWEGSLQGLQPIGPHQGRAAVVDFLSGFWEQQQDQRRHVFSNLVVDLETADRASAHAYLVLTSVEADIVRPVTTGPYRFDLLALDGIWRITRLSAGFDSPF
jgi:ketosteroid isomerase-like protein